MGFLRRVAAPPEPPPDNTPRHLNHADVQSFIDASGKRNERTIAASQRSHRQDFLGMLMDRHPLRMRRMNADLNWLLAQGRKHGLSADELRWLLW